MSELQETAILAGLFALRCIAPLLITLAIGMLMNRIVDRWEAEEAQLEEQGLMPEIPSGGVGERRLAHIRPCWLFKNCSAADRENCPAYQRPGLPCWLAHLNASGKLTSDCPDCPIYISAWAA